MPKTICFTLKATQVALLQEMQQAPNSALARRVTALLLLHAGHSPTEVAAQLKVSLKSVYTWHERWRSSGVEGLNDRPRSGRRPLLTEAQYTHLQTQLTTLKTDPMWQSKRRVAAYIYQTTGVQLPRRRLNQLLRELDWQLPQERRHLK